MKLLILLLLGLIVCITGFVGLQNARISLKWKKTMLTMTSSEPSSSRTSAMTSSEPSSSRTSASNTLNKFCFFVGRNSLIASSLLISTTKTAQAASITASTLAESKKAAAGIQECLTKISSMESMATSKEWTKIGKLLGDKCFTSFSDTAYILTKSDVITAEDKVALGTIKRYGVVADAIIMMGGLAEALRAGGIEVAGGGGGYSDQAPIIDEEERDNDEPKEVDAQEVMKFIKLSKGSLEDINRISSPLLKM
jgi:hypothetical protein